MAASPAPTPKFYTYAPGKGPGAIKLAPGQTLGYQAGKGYYAKGGGAAAPYAPAPPLISDAASGGGYGPTPAGPGYHPAPPPIVRKPVAPVSPWGDMAARTQAQVDAAAGTQAQQGVDAQSAEVRRQQALAAAQAKADEGAITGFTDAAGKLEAGISPAISAAYAQAVGEQGALGQGISGQVGADLQSAQDASNAMLASQGQSAGENVHVPDVQTTLGMLQGVIPGTQLAAEGAAASTWAAEQPQISLDAGRQQLDARMAQAHQDNDGYAQQLITIAATYPQLKAQALQQLNQYELDKANYRQSVVNSRADNARQNRALSDQEKAAGIDTKTKVAGLNAEYTYKYAALNFKNQQDAKKAALAHKTIDVPASKALGHVVYKDGSQDASIKVAQSGAQTPQSKATQNKYKDTVKAKGTMVSMAQSLRGKPQLAGKAAATYLGGHGKYIAAAKYKALGQGKPGSVYPDGTTNNIKRAAYSGDVHGYAQAQASIYEKVGGDTLAARYNIPKATIMQWIATAMNNAGWSK